jgi:nitrite reductase (NO-forming)
MDEPVMESRSWWAHHAKELKFVFRLLLGIAWLTDGILKFTSGYVDSFLSSVQLSQSNAPSWLSGWFSFWATQATNNANLIVYSVGILEILLGVALILGFMRKIAYAGGVVLSLLIWAVPEGFGGPYQSGSGGTDVGTGVIYAIAFLGLIVINATYGPSRLSIDHLIERKFPGWSRIAEFGWRPKTAAAPANGARTPAG